jgi:ADP-heptose:LPS heptosyltransferase
MSARLLKPLRQTVVSSNRSIEGRELEHLALAGQRDAVYAIFRSLPDDDRRLYANKYILSEVVAEGIDKLRKFPANAAEASAEAEKAFIDDVIDLFIDFSVESSSCSREFYQALLDWADELKRLSLLKESLRCCERAVELGIQTYPDLQARAVLIHASLLGLIGEHRKARDIILNLVQRPYVVPDRNLRATMLYELARLTLLAGDAGEYKRLLFQALRCFHSNDELRGRVSAQIARTYGRWPRVLMDRQLPIMDRLLFFTHRLSAKMAALRWCNAVGISRLCRTLILGWTYVLNYGWREAMTEQPTMHNRRRFVDTRKTSPNRVLLTRAMGGIGDLLMMTPGFHEYKRRNPGIELQLAIPRRYFPLFEGNPDVTLLDIENDRIDFADYRCWFNLTDCPAARVESRSAPRVRLGRIDIFAQALGLSHRIVRKMDKRPRYEVLPIEAEFQKQFWVEHFLGGRRVIGIQLHSDELYRDYPHVRQLIEQLAVEIDVVVFEPDNIQVVRGRSTERVGGLPLRLAFALASGCDAIIAPDSSFVHLAAALDIPCVALYGPIDGTVRTRYYPKCVVVDSRSAFGCLPCWRNESIRCALTGMRVSACMAEIPTDQIIRTLAQVLDGTER